MARKPTYEELEQRVKALEKEVLDLKRAEEKIEHLSLVLRSIRNVNQLITKEKDRERLLKGSCDTLIETRGYYNAWIAVLDESSQLVTMTEAGLGKNFLPMVEQLKRGELPACGQRALKKSDFVVTIDPFSTCTECPLSDQYSGRGGMTVRLEYGGKAYGLLFASIPRDFLTDKEEQSLFQEIARDIAFALYNIELEDDRKQAEEALRESEEKYRVTLQSIPDSVCITRQKDGLYFYTNEGFSQIMGYSMEEIEGKTPHDLNIFVNHADRDELIKILKEKGEVHGFELQCRRKDGTIFDALLSARPLKYVDEDCLVAVVKDITPIKKAEQEKAKLQAQFQQAQRMESIGTLAGGLAHNFNNLLMSIIGNASIVLLDLNPDHPHYKNLKNIEKNVKSGSRVTKQLLGYAREGRYEIKPISLNQLVKETADTVETTRKEIRVHQDLAENLYGINADQGQIEQVLMNLYVNAADAMPGGGDLFLNTMNVTDKDMADKQYDPKHGNYVLLTVKDTGAGMDKKVMERIFDPFFTTKGLAEGTGLGLASAYGIVKAHGGYIDVDSEEGKGTTFEIYLPATEEEVTEEKMSTDELIKGKGTVLLMDDEEMVLDAGEQMLRKLGYEVLLAKSGQEALELYKKNQDKIDTVLLDMVMPGMGGGETYDRLKEINPKVKVLLSSGYSIDGQAKEILKRGCDGFIQKPFSLEQLSQSIRKILDKG